MSTGGGPRRTQAQRRSQSEEALLDAAAALIAERGIERVSLAQIGERAGVSRGLPTHHFGSKNALVARLAQRAQKRLSEAMGDAIRQARQELGHATAFDVLRISVRAYLDLFQSATPDDRALIAMWGGMIPSDLSVEGILEADRRGVTGWSTVIGEGQRDGSIRPDVDARAAGVAIFGLTRGVAALILIDSEFVDLPAMRSTCEAWITAALAAP